MTDAIVALYAVIKQRFTEPAENSYTNYLFSEGKEKILKKVGEETTELVIASMQADKAEQVNELADLVYHLLVLMVNEDISLADLEQELVRRSAKTGNKKAERRPIEEI